MHELEPYHRWKHLYDAEEDERSPLYGQAHSEFEYSNTIYNYYIHPQWDEFGSRTLYLKVLYVDYDQNYAIVEFIGEWNDAVENDIMQLKRAILDPMIQKGIVKFVLICEGVLNFHSSDESYYEEWYEDIKDEGGWIVMLNMPDYAHQEIQQARLGRYLFLLSHPNWRTHLPQHLYQLIDNQLLRLIVS
ncbi:MAG: hypothetical protein QM642_00865 [Edaphocola sp.]